MKERFLTFPVEFIPRIINDDKSVYPDIFDYGIFKYYFEHCRYEDGDAIDEMQNALDFYNLTSNVETRLEKGEEIYFKYHGKGAPHVSVNKASIFEFRDEQKTARERELFGLNLAIRSIIGEKAYRTKVCYTWLLARFMGLNVPEDIESNGKFLPKSIKALYQKYYPTPGVKPSDCVNRRRRTKLLNETCKAWHIVKYAHKGFAFSIEQAENGLSLDELVMKVKLVKHNAKIEKAENDAKIKIAEEKAESRIKLMVETKPDPLPF